MTYEYDLNNFISTPSIGDRRLFIYNRYNEYVESITSDISHYFVKNNCLIIKITNKNDLILSFENRDIAQLALEKLSLYRKTLITNLSGTSGGVTGTTYGSSGTSGSGSGLTGSSGTSGTSGTSGITGTSGTSGIGNSGSSGTSGIGITGSSGTSGYGSSGISGVLNNSLLTTITGNTNYIIDFEDKSTIKLYLYSNINFTTTNLSSTESSVITILIENSGITSFDLTFPSEWLWIGYKPTQIDSFDKSILTVQNFGINDSDVVSSYVILTNGE